MIRDGGVECVAERGAVEGGEVVGDEFELAHGDVDGFVGGVDVYVGVFFWIRGGVVQRYHIHHFLLNTHVHDEPAWYEAD